MYQIPKQNNILEQAGRFIGGKTVDATAIAVSIGILRSGIKDPRIIMGAFSIYASAKQSAQLMGGLAGSSFDLYLEETFGINVDKFINDNIDDINLIIEKYFNKESSFEFGSNEYPNLTQSEREGLAYQIASGDNSGASYAAYNPNNSFVPVRRGDPLILDLNGDGVKTTSLQNSKTFFDLSGDGMSEQTGWVDSNDGLLVYDKNSNGNIDDVNELFGNTTQSGFSMLKQLFDANSDNLIDDKDINFSQLKVWQDINSDGISQENELKTLSELGISNINLGSTSTSIDSNGNTIKATSTFTQNGEIKQVADVDFTSSKMLTDYSKDYTLTIDALLLPWLRGYGTVKDAQG
jgi:hypothetical protein